MSRHHPSKSMGEVFYLAGAGELVRAEVMVGLENKLEKLKFNMIVRIISLRRGKNKY